MAWRISALDGRFAARIDSNTWAYCSKYTSNRVENACRESLLVLASFNKPVMMLLASFAGDSHSKITGQLRLLPPSMPTSVCMPFSHVTRSLQEAALDSVDAPPLGGLNNARLLLWVLITVRPSPPHKLPFCSKASEGPRVTPKNVGRMKRSDTSALYSTFTRRGMTPPMVSALLPLLLLLLSLSSSTGNDKGIASPKYECVRRVYIRHVYNTQANIQSQKSSCICIT